MKKIDIHVHSSMSCKIERGKKSAGTYATPAQLRAMYDKLSIDFGVNLPIISPESMHYCLTNEEAAETARLYPETLVFFCCLDPRMGSNSPETDFTYYIEYYKELGAKGIGEITSNLYFDDPRVWNMFRHAEMCGMPVLFHIGFEKNDYGLIDELGLPRLEKTLAKFPDLIFLGHSQKFWSEISGGVTEETRGQYPEGPVALGGRLIELMDKYNNLHCDLSAGSGYNALTRDAGFGCAFIEKYQDRLYFGTDICDPSNEMLLSFWLDEMLEAKRISRTAYEKVGRLNALTLLKIAVK